MIWNLLAENANNNQGGWTSYLMIGVLIIAIIGLFVWQTISGKKKQKEAQNMVNSLKIGDRVKTIGGICGFVAEINDAENTFVLRTGMEGNESFVKFDKGAIYQTAPAQGNAVAAPAAPAAEPAPAPAPVEEAKAEEPVAETAEAPKKKTRKKKDAEEK
ncbi:MAG: preprotein translocase subunit YajC [Clostridia bacterium]|nr:preprotein translocase subunit YajC [Clostridia bacterium]